MRWYFGYPVLAAGLFFGAKIRFPGEPADHMALPEPLAPKIAADEGPKVVSAAEVLAKPRSRLAAFSPGARLLTADAPPPKPTMFDYLAQAFAASAAPSPGHADASSYRAVAQGAWKSAVVHVAADADADTPKPAGNVQKALLARDVQRELHRVGCYVGEIDGVWGPGSQRAVTAFMERVNAVLPVDEPDVFMLSLLSAEPGTICGSRCPHGQTISSSGRCLPTTLLAHDGTLEPALRHGPTLAARAAHESDPPATGDGEWSVAVAEVGPEAVARAPDPFHGRMSIGGPRPPDAVAPQRFHRTVSLGPSLSTDTVEPVTGEGVQHAALVDEPPPQAERRPARRQAREPSARPRPAKSSRARNSARSNYRHVQRLFEHPLGRM